LNILQSRYGVHGVLLPFNRQRLNRDDGVWYYRGQKVCRVLLLGFIRPTQKRLYTKSC